MTFCCPFKKKEVHSAFDAFEARKVFGCRVFDVCMCCQGSCVETWLLRVDC